jgi:hypothetical protein
VLFGEERFHYTTISGTHTRKRLELTKLTGPPIEAASFFLWCLRGQSVLWLNCHTVDFPQRVSEPLQQKMPKRLNSLRPGQQGGTNGSPNDGNRCRYLR